MFSICENLKRAGHFTTLWPINKLPETQKEKQIKIPYWDLRKFGDERLKDAERDINLIVRRYFLVLLPFLVIIASGALHLFFGFSIEKIDQEKFGNFFEFMNFTAAVAAVCVALASAVVTYFLAMLAYSLAEQAKSISEKTLKVSEQTFELSQRESRRESAKLAAEVRAGLNRFSEEAQRYVTQIIPTSHAMYLKGRQHLVLLQWHLQCQTLESLHWPDFEPPYAQKKDLLLVLAEEQLKHLEDKVSDNEPEYLAWDRLKAALEADALEHNLSLGGVLTFWHEQELWSSAVDSIREQLDIFMNLWKAANDDSSLLQIIKGDAQRELAFSALHAKHVQLQKLFSKGKSDAQLVAVLRANALATVYFRHSFGSNLSFDEVFKYIPWMGLLWQGMMDDRDLFMSREIGVEHIRQYMEQFFSMMHMTQMQVNQIFHLEVAAHEIEGQNKRFLLHRESLDKTLDVLMRVQKCIEITHAEFPKIFEYPPAMENPVDLIDYGISRWRALTKVSIEGK